MSSGLGLHETDNIAREGVTQTPKHNVTLEDQTWPVVLSCSQVSGLDRKRIQCWTNGCLSRCSGGGNPGCLLQRVSGHWRAFNHHLPKFYCVLHRARHCLRHWG